MKSPSEEAAASPAKIAATAAPEEPRGEQRRLERRPAGAPRRHIAANDDVPSIGGLIYALEQRPSRKAFFYAFVASAAWVVVSGLVALTLVNSALIPADGGFFTHPLALTLLATLIVPITLFWFVAILSWRAQELRLMASAMTEVAVRLAEPDKLAEQSVASVGQAVRRQVAAMNDALSRALGRAGELEALVHNEVAALERSYSDNETRIRGLITELSNERQALSNNSERFSEALRGVGTQVAKQISTAGDNATKSLVTATSSIADTLAAKGEKITAALSAVGQSVDRRLAERGAQVTEQLLSQGSFVSDKLQRASQQVATNFQQSAQQVTSAMNESTRQVTAAVESRRKALFELLDTTAHRIQKEVPPLLQKLEGEQSRLNAIIEVASQSFGALESSLAQRTTALDSTLKQRTQAIHDVLSEQVNALDESFANNAQFVTATLAERIRGLDATLVEHGKLIDQTLTDKNRLIEQTFTEKGAHIDHILAERSRFIDQTLSDRTRFIDETMSEKSVLIDESLAEKSRLIEQTLSQRSNQIEQTLTEKSFQIEQTLAEKSHEIENTLSSNASAVERSLVRHTMTLSQLLSEGSEAVRQTTHELTAQSVEAADGLTSQADMLKDVSKRLLEQIHSLTQRFENQGHAIMSAAQALDSSNAKIDSILERRHEEISGLLTTVGTKARDLDSMMHSYTGLIENALGKAEVRAKELTATLAKDSAMQSRAALAEIEQLRAETRSHTERAVGELRDSFESITHQVADQIKTLTQHFHVATREMKDSAQRTVGEMEVTRQEMQRRMRDLPNETRQSTDAMRKMLADQMKALSSLSAMASEQANQQDLMRAREAPPPPPPAPPARPMPAAPLAAAGRGREPNMLGSVTADLARQLGDAGMSDRRGGLPAGGRAPAPAADGGRGDWSLGDLLARASEPEHDAYGRDALGGRDGYGREPLGSFPAAGQAYAEPEPMPVQPAPRPRAAPRSAELRFEDIAGSIDERTAAEIWQRFRSGERDFLGRHVYTPRGQATFDEISQRYRREPDFQGTADRYIADFERLLRDAHTKDRDGRLVQNYLSSETGRVYLMLGHASGRLR